ncbi:PTS glucose transporter subunit IIA [Pseudoalteromonas luteoviolacea]|uniref:PTS system glucose-specific EIIA component n=1 Tax=Pseudoalteromonas luteoviolacea DSM 6061 TaxID=1365250 RepID=A0A166V9G7_9GAMM|nr:PTS glucose transporter subunit IIA [Pseudoalteromonas luteoviolacea]KZN32394.1 hypothetical protein N475_22190 [Pseudoalteromonas luteoviolacea DSM 6061]KZN56708.1 hypothetical protein N474_11185 [Pseudoalteromonas luteoviolacea CPMOR-2]MBE0386094.1 PTS system, beta-glucosides-specific IIA component [Pseudoalteromonas luteoviolacea DSM 6061]TQF71005.1 PTS sugar transporter [Pseudoalteromonas luteoviolacea]
MIFSTPIKYAPITQIANPLLHIASPFSGKVLPLQNHPIQLFATGVLGVGVCVKSNQALMLAPCKGKVIKTTQQGCEFVIRAESGLQLLLHLHIPSEYKKMEKLIQHSVGKNTVSAGDVLCYFDVPQEQPILGSMVILNADKLGPCYYPLNQVNAGKDPLITLARACKL